MGLTLVLILGGISIIIGKQFLTDQGRLADQATQMQQEHIERNVKLHGDDLSLLLYYLKFALLNETDPLAGLSVGQSDLNPGVQRIRILALEGQKYDSDLVNPTKLLYGNLDLSFVIVYVFPLLVIAFMYNLFSEERESGTWQMVNVMARSKSKFLLGKLLVRFLLLAGVMLFLIGVGAVVLGVAADTAFLLFTLTALFYLIFWFALCFWVVCLRQNSNVNALVLLTIWLALVVLLPAFVNNYITNNYPLPEALSTMIKQRDGYHVKWDTSKKETMEKFYEEYPQFANYGFPSEKGYSPTWYYAMQHMGDVESREDSRAMQLKIRSREASSRMWAQVIPSMQAQLVFNEVAGTGLDDYMDFLQYMNEFHENLRLYFYPMIFSNSEVASVDWGQFTPEVFTNSNKSINWTKKLGSLVITILLFSVLSIFSVRKLI